MQLLKLEIKRVIKTRLTWILLLTAFLLSILLAYLPVTFVSVDYLDKAGAKVELTGLEAVKYVKEAQSGITGIVTEEKVKSAINTVQECLKEYKAEDTYDLPEGVYSERILPVSSFIRGVKEIFANPDTGVAPSIMNINSEKISNYYDLCKNRLASLMNLEQREHPAAQKNAIDLYTNVKTPFVFYPGYNTDAMDYEIILILFIAAFCTVIAAPVFSSDYQTGFDDISRCTRRGRKYLASIKITSTLIICITAFLICTSIYILISNSLFGWECTKTSMQVIFSIVSLPNFNMGELQIFTALSGLLSVIAGLSLTLFISSKCKNTTTALSISLFFCFFPIILYMMIPGELNEWLHCILPYGGIGLQNSMLYALRDFKFLNAGNFAVWTPFAIIFMAVVEIPLFIWCAVLSHSKYKMG